MLIGNCDKLFVKQFEEETNLRVHLVLDTSSSKPFPYQDKKISKKAFLVLCSAALIHLLRNQSDAVGLSTFSDEIELLTPAKLSVTHAQRLYAELLKIYNKEELGLNKKTQFSENLDHLAEVIHKRSLVIIFSDLMGDDSLQKILEALQHLCYNKHEVVLFAVTDHNLENQFNFANRPPGLLIWK